MHISILLMEQIVELFIMILMGFIIVKAGIVKDEDSKVLSKIVLYLIIPCVIIKAFQVDYTSKTVNGLLLALAGPIILPTEPIVSLIIKGSLILVKKSITPTTIEIIFIFNTIFFQSYELSRLIIFLQ